MGENFYYPTWELIIICSLCSILEIHYSNYFARFDRLINFNLKVKVLRMILRLVLVSGQ